jgi:hypothetical protein
MIMSSIASTMWLISIRGGGRAASLAGSNQSEIDRVVLACRRLGKSSTSVLKRELGCRRMVLCTGWTAR